MAKLWTVEASDGSETWWFDCPGCGRGHAIRTKGPSPCWEWNGSVDKPTFSPSILSPIDGQRCHSFVKDGMIQFLSDCDHALAGQTVEIPDWED